MLHYQPRIELKTGTIICVEALVRWRHPTRGLIPPGLFIPLAENTNLIHPLGKRILEMACRQLKTWQAQGIDDVRVAVNLSARQLHRSDLFEEIQAVLEATALPASKLELEVMESAAISDITGSVDKLRALKKLGVRIALDDFGTGYSSLSHLRDLPIDTLKLDRSFLEGLREPAGLENNLAIIRAIMALGKHLGLAVVAEGVEEKKQWDLLTELGCDEAQGFFLCHPLPPEELRELLEQRTINTMLMTRNR